MKKPITIVPFIGALCTIAISMFAWGYSMGSRLEAVETVNVRQDKTDEYHDKRIERVENKIDESLKTMHEKADRILYEIKKDK